MFIIHYIATIFVSVSMATVLVQSDMLIESLIVSQNNMSGSVLVYVIGWQAVVIARALQVGRSKIVRGKTEHYFLPVRTIYPKYHSLPSWHNSNNHCKRLVIVI